ncbi:MAG: EF-P lysine aminoacylase GenX [Hyphomicrobiales bacterium]|nr:MAG: EF-P lysine aminoacylase GenX [Hyphomicrobiales bacterium]
MQASASKPPAPTPWWNADRHADRRGFLIARDRIKKALRQWFEAEGFIEVEPAALQTSPGNEVHLHAFGTDLVHPDETRQKLYLNTSPEFACKKLLAAGETRIFSLQAAYRNRERGALHHPAFTMLEWYRAGAPYETLMEDCAAILRIAADAAGRTSFSFRGRSADPRLPPERLSVAEAFARYAGIDLLATLTPDGCDRAVLAAAARDAGIRFADDETWGDIFSRILVERIEPAIGNGAPTILMEYPAVLAALARPEPRDARVAQRFELYASGVELANAFGELTDPAVQRACLEAEMAERQRIYGERYPVDDDFIAALAQMPPASGAALGFDRLVMLATGASHIEQVLWTPVPEPRPPTT